MKSACSKDDVRIDRFYTANTDPEIRITCLKCGQPCEAMPCNHEHYRRHRRRDGSACECGQVFFGEFLP